MLFYPKLLKTIIFYAKYKAIDIIVKALLVVTTTSNDHSKKRIIIIKTDGIGDYILFRKQLIQYKNLAKQYDCELTLLCSDDVAEIANYLDKKYLTQIISINKNDFLRNIKYRIKLLLKLKKYCYRILFSPTYSKDFFINEWLVNFIDSENKIGRTGDRTNISNFQYSISRNYYDFLITDKTIIEFEHYKNSYFTNKICSLLNVNSKPINLSNEYKVKDYADSDFCILFIGGSNRHKRWSIDHFLGLSQMIFDNLNLKSVLCGSQDDLKILRSYAHELPSFVINKIGQLSLIELTQLLAKGNFIVTNDTSAAHISGFLLKKKTFVIYSGLHFCRFLPYPENLELDCHVVLHSDILANKDNYKIKSNAREDAKYLNINEISIEEVFREISKSLH